MSNPFKVRWLMGWTFQTVLMEGGVQVEARGFGICLRTPLRHGESPIAAADRLVLAEDRAAALPCRLASRTPGFHKRRSGDWGWSWIQTTHPPSNPHPGRGDRSRAQNNGQQRAKPTPTQELPTSLTQAVARSGAEVDQATLSRCQTGAADGHENFHPVGRGVQQPRPSPGGWRADAASGSADRERGFAGVGIPIRRDPSSAGSSGKAEPKGMAPRESAAGASAAPEAGDRQPGLAPADSLNGGRPSNWWRHSYCCSTGRTVPRRPPHSQRREGRAAEHALGWLTGELKDPAAPAN